MADFEYTDPTATKGVMPLTGHREYAAEWTEESAHLDVHGIYAALVERLPHGRILEIGCGTGRGASHLLKLGPVLSLDNNIFLLDEARRRVAGRGDYSTHRCDLLELTSYDRQVVEEFNPEVIVAWFLGGSGSDVFRRTTEQPNIMEKGKLYREKIEDVLTSGALLVPSVHSIGLANRGGRLVEFSDSAVAEAESENYDEYVFRRCGFHVSDVRVMDWPRSGSSFRYGAAHNPNLAHGTPVPAIISINATRSRTLAPD